MEIVEKKLLKLGGTLLVAQSAAVPFTLPAAGLSIPVPLPSDAIFCGVPVFFQVLVIDPGASRGVSFSPGLVLNLGS